MAWAFNSQLDQAQHVRKRMTSHWGRISCSVEVVRSQRYSKMISHFCNCVAPECARLRSFLAAIVFGFDDAGVVDSGRLEAKELAGSPLRM